MITKTKGIMDGDIEYTSPSYGIVSIGRVNCNPPVPLFGSSIRHSSYIRMTISEGRRNRGLNRDTYHDGDRIIELNLSEAQFAELITTMNCGAGTPATIAWHEGNRIEHEGDESKIEEHSREFEKRMDEFAKEIDNKKKQVEELMQKKSIGKGDREQIKNMFGRMVQEIRSNIPFFKRQFDEQMDKTVTESKAEIDSFITSAIHQTGLEQLRSRTEHIEIPEDINSDNEQHPSI